MMIYANFAKMDIIVQEEPVAKLHALKELLPNINGSQEIDHPANLAALELSKTSKGRINALNVFLTINVMLLA